MTKKIMIIYYRLAEFGPVIQLLRQEGYDAEFYSDPTAAIDAIWQGCPDFIGIGMYFQEFTGQRLINLILSGCREHRTSIPVLMMGETQIDPKLAEIIALHSGASAFLRLPCTPEKFLELVQLHLEPERVDPVVRDRWEQRNAIYVVDDEHYVTRLIEKAFKRVNIPVVQFQESAHFFERLREARPRAVLLDYLLDGLTGLDVLLQIREIDPAVPVIAITGRGSEEVAVSMFRLGAADYLRKPFDLDTLPDIVNRAVVRHHSLVLADALAQNLLDLDAMYLNEQEANAKLAALNAELQRTKRELEDLNQFKGTLLAACGHDLRAPLVSLISGSETLREFYSAQMPADAVDIVRAQHGASMRLLTILNNLLDMELIENQQLHLELQRGSLISLVRDCLQDMSHLAASYEITITEEYPAEDIMLYRDREKLTRVMYNLLANAIKYNRPRGKILIRVSRGDGTCRVEIADTGYGIPPQNIEEIFEKFKSVTRPERRLSATTGLGLYLCRQFVELHGGKIWAESVEEEGSRFFFELPIVPPRSGI